LPDPQQAGDQSRQQDKVEDLHLRHIWAPPWPFFPFRDSVGLNPGDTLSAGLTKKMSLAHDSHGRW
jgi:hypothetical protein